MASNFTLWGILLALLTSLTTTARAQTVEYIHTDALGTPVAVTDASGNVIERSEYEPYGKVLKPETPQDGPGYTGQVFDSATGLNYMQQRYYDPAIGRFLSVDPVAAREKGDNFNRYAYAFNNPYKFTDPDGRDGLIGPEYRMAQPQPVDVVEAIVAVGCQCDPGAVAPSGSGAVESVGTPLELVATGGGAARVAGKGAAQTGEQVVARLAKGAIKDDVKGNVRQIVKSASQMRQDAAAAARGAKVGEPTPTAKGSVQTATHSDGTTVSARSFSGKDGSGPPTIQVNRPKTDEVVKVRYDNK